MSPHSGASHRLMKPCVLAKSHVSASEEPSSSVLWASETWKDNMVARVCQPGRGNRQCGRGPTPKAPFPVRSPSVLDKLLLFTCNLGSDQAGSPLITSVIPLHNPVQQICFPKKAQCQKLSSSEGNPLLLAGIGVLTGRSHQLCWLSTFAQNHTEHSVESL